MFDFFSRFADNTNNESWAHRCRMARFRFFAQLLRNLPPGARVLDVGGTQAHWEMMGELPEIHVTLLNLEKEETSGPQFDSIAASALELPFADGEFDAIYSNSVIEHLFTWENQVKMADEVRRVGRNYFVQTPNYFFPIEPHWVFPGFQYLPKFTRVALIRRFQLGHMDRIEDRKAAWHQIEEVKLLTVPKMRRLFPDGLVWREKIGPLTKSIVSYRFDDVPATREATAHKVSV